MDRLEHDDSKGADKYQEPADVLFPHYRMYFWWPNAFCILALLSVRREVL